MELFMTIGRRYLSTNYHSGIDLQTIMDSRDIESLAFVVLIANHSYPRALSLRKLPLRVQRSKDIANPLIYRDAHRALPPI
jgi:hypothetical protein